MIRCTNCGFENDDDSLFCEECGTKLEKIQYCGECGAPIKAGKKFCTHCGARVEDSCSSNSEGVSIGDKNVIGGDVIGSKEDYHISGNATFVKTEDETKKVNVCQICGKHVTNDSGYTCSSCGRIVCNQCFDLSKKRCCECSSNQVSIIRKKLEQEFNTHLEYSSAQDLCKLLAKSNNPQKAEMLEELLQEKISFSKSDRIQILSSLECSCHNVNFWNILIEKTISDSERKGASEKLRKLNWNDLKDNFAVSIENIIADGADVRTYGSEVLLKMKEPLMMVSYYGFGEDIESGIISLLKAGLNPNTCDKDMDTPFILACSCGSLSLIKTFVKIGSDYKIETNNKNSPNYNGLGCSVIYNYNADCISSMKYLHSLGLNFDKITPLHDLLGKHSSRLWPYADEAITSNLTYEKVKTIIEFGEDVNKQDSIGNTALHYFAESAIREINIVSGVLDRPHVKKSLKECVKFEYDNNAGTTNEWILVSERIAKLFVEKGFDFSLLNKNGDDIISHSYRQMVLDTMSCELKNASEYKGAVGIALCSDMVLASIYENGSSKVIVKACIINPDDKESAKEALEYTIKKVQIITGQKIKSLHLSYYLSSKLYNNIVFGLFDDYCISTYYSYSSSASVCGLQNKIGNEANCLSIQVNDNIVDISTIEVGDDVFEIKAHVAKALAQTKSPALLNASFLSVARCNQSLKDCINEALEESEWTIDDVTHVVVGGNQILDNSVSNDLYSFGNKMIIASNEDIAKGASFLNGISSGLVQNLLLRGLSYDIVIRKENGEVETVMPRNTTIPSKASFLIGDAKQYSNSSLCLSFDINGTRFINIAEIKQDLTNNTTLYVDVDALERINISY